MHVRASRYTQDEIVRCAWLYYERDHTQDEIAHKLGMSRSRVVRLLKEAKAQGLIQIKINAPVHLLSLAEQLQSRYQSYNLRNVRLVQTIANETEQKKALAGELAPAFTPTKGDIIAVTWGTTLGYAIDQLPLQPQQDLTVASILGGVQGGIHTASPYDIAFRLGQRLQASVYTLQAPVFVRDPEVASLLLREETLQDTLRVATKARIALFGAGDLTEKSTLESVNAISREERLWLRDQGAVGDLLGHFLDRHGCALNLHGRLTPISLPLEHLLTIPERICIGGGSVKHAMLLALLRGNYITTLITDEATARYLISVAPYNHNGGKKQHNGSKNE
ncbi:sugar-binding transcriptional regulator [Ktedonosporobacter rubrisoli]|uniref:Sugar-binding transcriptional regulator n=1 Tax=Ktedonosporobacter rubrisoli TaxID=2509675 RepID=A0A4P6JMJ9_KTERU|nr:sugar-binding transcriptional regulator [Ktedonosporobacter rubrisoli]QBD76507.1 sugar-binding transcriptional regulator [Ktedonosporobacter rubrisoli]